MSALYTLASRRLAEIESDLMPRTDSPSFIRIKVVSARNGAPPMPSNDAATGVWLDHVLWPRLPSESIDAMCVRVVTTTGPRKLHRVPALSLEFA